VETNNFDISLLLSMKIINFFMVFMSFVPSSYWCFHLHIEPKHQHGFG